MTKPSGLWRSFTSDTAVPIDLLAEADSRGLMLTEFDQPRTYHEQGDFNGNYAEEELHDCASHLGICVSMTIRPSRRIQELQV